MILKKNVGNMDSIIRVLIGGIIMVTGLYFDSLWGLLGIIPVLSGAASFCPVYRYLKIDNTDPTAERAN